MAGKDAERPVAMTDEQPLPLTRAAFVEALTRDERYVLALYYGEELTIAEIALVLRTSEADVRQTLGNLHDLATAALTEPEPAVVSAA